MDDDRPTVDIRPIAPTDAARLEAFHESLSERSVYLRFFGYHRHLTNREVEHFTRVDGVERMAFVATSGGAIVAVGRYDRDRSAPDDAEVAFVVADSWQGHGLAHLLLQRLAEHARERGVRRFTAVTLPENGPMQHVFRHAGFPVRMAFAGGVIEVAMDIATPPAA